MFVDREIEEVEGVARALEDRPLLRAAFTAGGLTSAQVLSLIREEAESGSAEPSSAGVQGGRSRPAPARRTVSRDRLRPRGSCPA